MSESILDRYQNYRIRRYLKAEAKYAQSLPSWRSQARRRILVGILVAAILMLVASSIFAFFGPDWAPLTWVPGALVMTASWSAIQMVSGRRSDAPADALDEWDLQRRNSARSIGFAVTQAFVMIPAFVLIWGTSFTDDPRLALGGGFLILSGLIAGICTPGIILAWTNPDPDPEDLVIRTEEGMS
jgi:hypothetical protein